MSNDTHTQGTDQVKETRENNRTQPRTQVKTPVRVSLPESDEVLTVTNQDLSWGGASFLLPRQALRVNDAITIEYPWTHGKFVSARAEVLRTQVMDDGQCLVAVRFSSMSPRNQDRLERLLAMLLEKKSDGQGSVPHLSAKLEILFNDSDDMMSTLSELKSSRLSVTTFQPYRTNQSIQLAVAGVTDLPALNLRARVVSCRAEETGIAGMEELFEIDLELEHSTQHLKQVIAPLIKEVLKSHSGPESALPQDPRESSPGLESAA